MHKGLKILIPLDGSKEGESALPYVERLLSKISSEAQVELTLLLVLTWRVNYLVVGEYFQAVPYTEQEMDIAKNQSMDYLNKVGEPLRNKGIAVTARVFTGDAAEEIIKAAEEGDFDMIAMSTHGRSGVSRWAFGSVTDKVLRLGGRIPILTVKATKPDE